MKLLQVTPLLRRVPRTRRSYAAIPDGQPSDATKASVTLKRFWKEVSLDQHSDTGFRVKLDGKPIRTPSNHPLVIPKNRKLLAAMVAHEWDSQDKLLKTHALPLVGSHFICEESLTCFPD
jgi:ATP synthase F1 complex assembly factor 2